MKLINQNKEMKWERELSFPLFINYMFKKVKLSEARIVYRNGILHDFPRSERISYKLFKKLVKENVMDTYCYYLDGNFYGYIVTKELEDVIFICYLAIKENYRGKGYGSKLLKELTENFKNKKFIILEANSESMATNDEELQTIKCRKNFYLKNGFEEIKNIEYNIYGVSYDLLIYKLNASKISNYEAIDIMKKFYAKIAANIKFFNLKVKE
jgi:ribosomal protein S18 acetylase RimI-like enzyme